MRFSAIILFVSGTIVAAFAEDALPSDVAALSEQRAAAMLKIDRSYLAELDKLKVKYTKAGNLDAANAIVALVGRVRENLIGTILTSGSWRYQMENGTVVSRTFVNRELLSESGRRYAFGISKDTVRIDWGGGAFEEMTVDLDNPQRIDGINDKGGKFKYFR